MHSREFDTDNAEAVVHAYGRADFGTLSACFIDTTDLIDPSDVLRSRKKARKNASWMDSDFDDDDL